MQRLWSPWRSKYIASGVDAQAEDCIFCRIVADPDQDPANYVLHRGEHSFIVLNLYPYITGHLMIVPYLHTSEFDALPKEISDEMMDLSKRSQTALREVYSPSGFNMGMNLGSAAGAGAPIYPPAPPRARERARRSSPESHAAASDSTD